MADVGGDAAVGLAAKAGSAGIAGALWGVFATMFLMVPAIITGVIFPFAKKAHTTLNNKINEEQRPKREQGKMTKAEREYQRRLDQLNAEKEEQELEDRLRRLQRRKAAKSAEASAHVV